MIRFPIPPRTRTLLCVALLLLGSGMLRAETAEAEKDPAPQPEQRPRLFHPTELHPYRGGGARYLDPWFTGGFYGYPYGGAGWIGNPYGYGYGWGRWGYPSHLYYDTFYGMLPAPGRSQLSISVGSDNYVGTSLSTTQWLSKKHNIALNVGALWESGELWWSGQDYESFTIAPTLYWSNENTLIYASFEHTERKVAGFSGPNPTALRTEGRPTLEANDSHAGMSPFASEVAGAQDPRFRATDSTRFRGFPESDHTLQRATIGIDHEVTDSFRIGLQVEAADLKRKR